MDNRSRSPVTQLTQAELNYQLRAAAVNGQSEQVTALIAQGADLNAKNQFSNTALMYAAYNGHADVVTTLLSSAHFDATTLNATNQWGRTALIMAAVFGHAAIVTALLSSTHFNATTLNATDQDGKTALMWAAQCGHNEVAFSLFNSMSTQAIIATRPNPSFIDRVLFRAPVITSIEASYNQALTQLRQSLRNIVNAFNKNTSRPNLGTVNALMHIIADYYAPNWFLNSNREMQDVLREITNPIIFSRTSNIKNSLQLAFNRLTNAAEPPAEQGSNKKHRATTHPSSRPLSALFRAKRSFSPFF